MNEEQNNTDPSMLPMPPSDLVVSAADRKLAHVITGEKDEASLNRAAQYIRQYVDACTEELRDRAESLERAIREHQAEQSELLMPPLKYERKLWQALTHAEK